MKIDELVDQLKKLNLQKGEHAVYGSAVLAIRNIREAPNIDVIVTNKLWKELLSKGYKPDSEGFIRVNLVKISNWWFAPTPKPLNMMISESEDIMGVPFVKLEYVRWYKSKLTSEKDKKDVQLIDDYVLKHDEKIPFGLGLEQYRMLIDRFLKEVKKDMFLKKAILGCIVFGSVSRNQAKGDSDIDIFVFYDSKLSKKAEVVSKINLLLVNIRKSKEYKELLSKRIEGEIYPFCIGSENVSSFPWVGLDSINDGQVILDTSGYVKNVKNEIDNYLKSIGARRVNLGETKWCWFIPKITLEINNTSNKIMTIEERSKMLFDAAEESLAQAKFSHKRSAYNLVVRRCQESVELALSGLLSVLGIHYPKNHDQAPLLLNVLEKKNIDLGHDKSKIEKISVDLSRKRGPALHQDEGFDAQSAATAIKDATYILDKINGYKLELERLQ